MQRCGSAAKTYINPLAPLRSQSNYCTGTQESCFIFLKANQNDVLRYIFLIKSPYKIYGYGTYEENYVGVWQVQKYRYLVTKLLLFMRKLFSKKFFHFSSVGNRHFRLHIQARHMNTNNNFFILIQYQGSSICGNSILKFLCPFAFSYFIFFLLRLQHEYNREHSLLKAS